MESHDAYKFSGEISTSSNIAQMIWSEFHLYNGNDIMEPFGDPKITLLNLKR